MSSCNKSKIEWEPRECNNTDKVYSLAGADQDSKFEKLLEQRDKALEILRKQNPDKNIPTSQNRTETKPAPKKHVLSKLKRLKGKNIQSHLEQGR